LAPVAPKSKDYIPRIFFDTAFFICVGLILLVTLTALLVDALGKSRAEGFRKREAESNVCFISGITREEYEKEGLTTSFDVHIHDTHNPFMYVAYVAYLKKKPRQRLTGMEEHILDQIDGCLPWTPLRTSHAIEIRRKEKGHYGREAKST